MFVVPCDVQAGTPGCTKEACKFRDEYGKFIDAECEVFGISSDSPEANAAFAKKERLPFPLLTDQNDFLRKSFGIKGNVFGMLKGRQVSSSVCASAHMLLLVQPARLIVLVPAHVCSRASFVVIHETG